MRIFIIGIITLLLASCTQQKETIPKNIEKNSLIEWVTNPNEGNILKKDSEFRLKIKPVTNKSTIKKIEWKTSKGKFIKKEKWTAVIKTPKEKTDFFIIVWATDEKGKKEKLIGTFKTKTIKEKLPLGAEKGE